MKTFASGETYCRYEDSIRGADIFIHNNRPQVMSKLGLDYAAMRAVNPRIIYCGAYGYSRKGPAPGQASHYYSRPHLAVHNADIILRKREIAYNALIAIH